MGIRRWIRPQADKALCDHLSEETGLPLSVCQILAVRSIDTPEAVEEFLGESDAFESPMNLIDMDKAVERIGAAIGEGEKIAVYGDYDCDGITSTALLTSYLQSVGADAFYYIPDREKDGYGMNKAAVDILYGMGVNLIVTVDNGISAHEEIDYAKSLDIDVVVTDHHTPRETLPDAVAVVNPHRADCPSTFKDFAGVGVAFQLICALEEADGWELLEHYSDLVTIGTVADVVPLCDENRSIVRHGLEHLREGVRPGINALLEIAGISTEKPLTADSVAFGIAPRLNAAGRMGSVDDAVELLMTDDAVYANELAAGLQELNLQRRGTEDDILRQIEATLAEKTELLKKRVLIVSGLGWHHGVVGIVASRLMERYGKPVIVLSIEDGVARGSGRSLEGFDLIGAITACSEKLIHYGGHLQAAGVTLAAGDIDSFDAAIQAHAAEHYNVMPVPSLSPDAILAPEQLTVEGISALGVLGPFGAGNPSPLFLLENLSVAGVYPTADKKHLRLKLSANGRDFMAIFFRMSEADFPYKPGDMVDIVASVDAEEWNGAPQVSVKIRDLRGASLPQEELILAAERYNRHSRGEYGPLCPPKELVPDRDELAVVYRFLRSGGGYPYAPEALWERLRDKGIDFAKLLVALDVFEEMGLIHRNGKITLNPNAGKVELSDSKILSSLNEK